MENNGEAKWYVVHTYTGHEKMVEDNLKKMIENSNLQDFIQEIAIPVEEDIVEKNGKKKGCRTQKIPRLRFCKTYRNGTHLLYGYEHPRRY